jgi:hypothetical protein
MDYKHKEILQKFSTGKVELNIASELKKLEKELDRGRDELMQFATDAREAIARGVREMNRVDSVYNLSKKMLNEAQSKAKKLGVEIPEAKQLNSAITAYEQQKKTLTKILK